MKDFALAPRALARVCVVALAAMLGAVEVRGREPVPPDVPVPPEAAPEVPPPGPPAASGEEPAEVESEAGLEAPAEEKPGAEDENDPCRVLIPSDAPWIDRARVALARTLCTSVDRADRYFGGREYDERREGTWGRLTVLADWDERDGWGGKGRLRARIQLPRTKQRLYALVGRGDENELLQDRGEAFTALPESFRSLAEDEWLLGLGYSPPRQTRGRFRLDAGVRVDTPLEPYVRGNWSTARFFGEESLGRFRQTVFWRGDDGWGTTGRLDLERLLGDRFLFRWTNSGTWSQETDGVYWYSTGALYQSLGEGRAIAWYLRSEGETGEEAAVRLYGVGATLRLNVLRRWLFLELRPALNWRRHEGDDRRELVPAFAVGLEIALDNDPR
ncbi:MAG TPA: hypothetical protein VLA75_11810 [Thermoanaerobaculia bacterium]|nr:hypothetical protein [Thermoanaerobaculia bacterium]